MLFIKFTKTLIFIFEIGANINSKLKKIYFKTSIAAAMIFFLKFRPEAAVSTPMDGDESDSESESQSESGSQATASSSAGASALPFPGVPAPEKRVLNALARKAEEEDDDDEDDDDVVVGKTRRPPPLFEDTLPYLPSAHYAPNGIPPDHRGLDPSLLFETAYGPGPGPDLELIDQYAHYGPPFHQLLQHQTNSSNSRSDSNGLDEGDGTLKRTADPHDLSSNAFPGFRASGSNPIGASQSNSKPIPSRGEHVIFDDPSDDVPLAVGSVDSLHTLPMQRLPAAALAAAGRLGSRDAPPLTESQLRDLFSREPQMAALHGVGFEPPIGASAFPFNPNGSALAAHPSYFSAAYPDLDSTFTTGAASALHANTNARGSGDLGDGAVGDSRVEYIDEAGSTSAGDGDMDLDEQRVDESPEPGAAGGTDAHEEDDEKAQGGSDEDEQEDPRDYVKGIVRNLCNCRFERVWHIDIFLLLTRIWPLHYLAATT